MSSIKGGCFEEGSVSCCGIFVGADSFVKCFHEPCGGHRHVPQVQDKCDSCMLYALAAVLLQDACVCM
jgi:hypothetical protein